MLKRIYKKNRYKFLLSLLPVVIVGIMAPLRSYIMQLLIDFSNYREVIFMIYTEFLVNEKEWDARRKEGHFDITLDWRDVWWNE